MVIAGLIKMIGYVSVYYGGKWIENDQNIMEYVGGDRKVVKISKKMTLKGLLQLLSEKCHIDRTLNNIQLCMQPKWINIKCPAKIKNDEDVKSLIDLSIHSEECVSVFVTNPLRGGGNYVGPFVNNVPIDPFKWLPDFPPQPSTSTSTNSRFVTVGNFLKIGDIFRDKKHLKDAMRQFALEI